jgi:hypothetical protein
MNYLLLLALLALTSCEYSGLKAAITSDFFKILTKYDLNKILQNKTMIDYAEASGSALFNYEVVCENLWMTYVKSPGSVVIDQETTSDGLPQVKVTLNDIEVAIEIAQLYVKYGLISDDFYEVDGDVKVQFVEGRYHFTTDGKLVLSEFNVEIDELTIDVKKSFLNWLIGLFKGLIKSQITKKLDELSGTISDAVNNWVENKFNVEIGWGVTLNLTNTMRPNLTQIYKGETFDIKLLKLMKAIIPKEELDEELASVITFGMHGSAFPTDDPDTHADFPPIVDMDFNYDYFTNEVQALLSTYTLDTILYISQKVGALHYTFTNESHPIFNFNFDTEGMQTLIPQYGDKYPNQSIPVEMAVEISPNGHERAYIEMTDAGANLVVNFNLNFTTNGAKDLAMNVTANIPFTIQVKYDLLTINWGSINVTKLVEQANELKVPHEELVKLIGTMFDKYFIKSIQQYTKNIALPAILSLITGMEFKNFKFETHEGYLLISIAVNLD